MIALLKRDLVLAFRSGGGFGLALAFFLIVVMFVPFGVGPQGDILGRIAPGILWIGALLASLLSLDRIFQLDFEDGTLDLLATSPLPLEGVVAIKALTHWLTTGLPLTLVAPVLGLLLNLPTEAFNWTFLSLLVGAPALSFLGAFGAALTVGLKRGGLLLSLLVLPLCIPTLIFGSQVIVLSAQGIDNTTAFAATAAISLFTFALVPFAAAAALRMNIR